jgi:hypothetical protein
MAQNGWSVARLVARSVPLDVSTQAAPTSPKTPCFGICSSYSRASTARTSSSSNQRRGRLPCRTSRQSRAYASSRMRSAPSLWCFAAPAVKRTYRASYLNRPRTSCTGYPNSAGCSAVSTAGSRRARRSPTVVSSSRCVASLCPLRRMRNQHTESLLRPAQGAHQLLPPHRQTRIANGGPEAAGRPQGHRGARRPRH